MIRSGAQGRLAAALLLAIWLGPGHGAAQTEPPVTSEETGGTLPPPEAAGAKQPPRDPSRGQVTNLPVPRFVTLKTDEGNARRGPGLSHRIDWVFKRAGMPLKVTAEYENWRRVEDQEGLGGWIHYSLLSGVRSVIIMAEMADFRAAPDSGAEVVLRAEHGVVARVMECGPDWCRLNVEGNRGWVIKAALWGVEPGEVID